MESKHTSNLQKWLRDFSRGEDAGVSFEKTVTHLSPLIFQTAYRKCGNEELAKDVTQAVLIIIAKKAASLSKHPAILGWVHETTRTETLRTMRAHARRKKREEAAMRHQERSTETNREILEILDESMKCLSASEKELVLMKYFEDRTYQSITSQTGRSESAEKMRLKRALEKMSGWLGRKGVTLSITALGALLTTEMAKGAPVIAINSAAATSALSTGNVVTQTLASMSTGKLALGTGLVVLAGSAQPIASAWQEYREINEARSRLVERISNPERSSRRMVGSQPKTESISAIVDSLTDIPKDRYTSEELSLKLIDAVEYRDQAMLHEIDQILAQFDIEELSKLATTINTRQRNDPRLSSIEHLMTHLPKDWTHQKRIDWALAVHSDENVVTSIFSSWVSQDSQAARKWLIEETKAGTLEMTGISNDPEGRFWHVLMDKLSGDFQGEKGISSAIFLSLPEKKRRRLSNYRSHHIPRLVVRNKYGFESVMEIIRETNDSSERHWINALVKSDHAPKSRLDFEQWIKNLDFNEIEHEWAMSFFKEEAK